MAEVDERIGHVVIRSCGLESETRRLFGQNWELGHMLIAGILVLGWLLLLRLNS